MLNTSDDRSYTLIKQATVGTTEVTISIIIPSYNTAKYVVEAVNSALSQTFGWLEIIVIDDGSTDCSLQELGCINDPRVTIVLQENRGLAGARNTGILLARGKYIGLLDSDDVWYPQKAEKQLAAMEANPNIGLTFSYSAYLSEEGAPTGHLLISRCMQPTARELALRNHIGNGSTPIIRRECFEEAGLFAESLRSSEDYEMWVRIAARTKWSVQLIPEVLTGYRVRPGSLTNSFSTFAAQARIAIECIQQCLPDLSLHDVARCHAEILRIASRKALSNGDVQLSRTLMVGALRHCPWLTFVDVRATGLLLIHLFSLPFPKCFEMSVYRFAQKMMHAFYLVFEASLKAPRRGWGQ